MKKEKVEGYLFYEFFCRRLCHTIVAHSSPIFYYFFLVLEEDRWAAAMMRCFYSYELLIDGLC